MKCRKNDRLGLRNWREKRGLDKSRSGLRNQRKKRTIHFLYCSFFFEISEELNFWTPFI